MQEFDELQRLKREMELSFDVDQRLKEIKEALQRMERGEIKRIVIYKKGPIQES
jgi:hypothetical protein